MVWVPTRVDWIEEVSKGNLPSWESKSKVLSPSHCLAIVTALAIGLGACINAGLLFYHLRKGSIFKLNVGWLMFLFKITFATFVMALGLFYFKGNIDLWLNYSASSRFLHLISLILFGAILYFIALRLCKLDISEFLKKTIH